MDDMIELHANAKDPNQEEADAKRKEAEEKVFNWKCMDATLVHNVLSYDVLLYTQAHENIQKAQEKQKILYDKKHNVAAAFSVGSVVLKKDFRRKKRRGGKVDFCCVYHN